MFKSYIIPLCSIVIVNMLGVAESSSLLCTLLFHLKEPPIFNLQNFTLTLYPVNTKLCPDIDGNKYVAFHLYTRRNQEVPQQLKFKDDNSVRSSNLDFSRKTVFFMHGFTESLHADNSQVMKNYFLNSGDYNVIIVDAHILLAGLYYIEAAYNCKFVGKFIAAFIDHLVTRGLKLRDLHVIGFSLGAHVMGYTGNFVKSGRLPRITGLDPAGPLFNFNPPKYRLDPSDADFVDVIHASSYLFGYVKPTGHVDFFPNGGGPKQPRCSFIDRSKDGSLNEFVFCEHYRAFRLFARSLLQPKRYLASKCTSYTEYSAGICSSNDVQYMGIAVNRTARGSYFIHTGDDAYDVT